MSSSSRSPCAARGSLFARRISVTMACTLVCAAPAWADDALSIRGDIGVEYIDSPEFVGIDAVGNRFSNPEQIARSTALKATVDLSRSFGESFSVGARFFAREDMRDDQRDDVRADELWLQYATEHWDVRAGNQIVTWGSVESFSPVDSVNPRDYVEDVVEPGKIGVPAVRVRRRFERGDLTAYWLPRYQPAQYPGTASFASFTGGIEQNAPEARWERDEFALRYFHSGDGFDIGVSYFSGYDREPSYVFDTASGTFEGRAYRSRRLGFEATKVIGDLVLKSELSARYGGAPGDEKSLIYVLGGEYTFSSVWEHSDATLFVEYMGATGEGRNEQVFQNDVFVLLRWSINDQRNQLLQAGFAIDLEDTSQYVWRLEYSLRPVSNFETGLKYTLDREYYPGPREANRQRGVLNLFLRYNF
jgi:hypothetical protein